MLKLIVTLYVYLIFVVIANELDADFLICRKCGHKISNARNSFYIKSPYAMKIWNETLFDSDNFKTSQQSLKPDIYSSLYQTIQLVKNSHGNKFKIITLKKADLFLMNETKSLQDTWFPSFKWIIGVCSHCFTHLGWYFESIENNQDGFFGLIVDSLINENYADGLIVQPKFKTS
jgi:hypothetical protein